MDCRLRIVISLVLGSVIWAPAVAQKRDDAVGLLRRVRDTYGSLKSFQFEGNTMVDSRSADLQSKMNFPFEAEYAPPAKFRIEARNPAFGVLIVSDGQAIWTYLPSTKIYNKVDVTEMPVSPAGTDADHARERLVASTAAAGLTFDIFQSEIANQVKEARILRDERLELEGKEVPCYVVWAKYERTQEEAKELPTEETYWIDKTRLIVLREDWEAPSEVTSGIPSGSAEMRLSTTLTKAKLNEPVPNGLFTFVPPRGAREGKMPKISSPAPTSRN